MSGTEKGMAASEQFPFLCNEMEKFYDDDCKVLVQYIVLIQTRSGNLDNRYQVQWTSLEVLQHLGYNTS